MENSPIIWRAVLMAETDLTTSGETVYSEADSGWKEALGI